MVIRRDSSENPIPPKLPMQCNAENKPADRMPLRIITPRDHSAAKTTMPNAHSRTFIVGPFTFAASGTRAGDPVGEDPALVCSCTGAGTTVRIVTVTTAPPSCVEVKTSTEVTDRTLVGGEVMELDKSRRLLELEVTEL